MYCVVYRACVWAVRAGECKTHHTSGSRYFDEGVDILMKWKHSALPLCHQQQGMNA